MTSLFFQFLKKYFPFYLLLMSSFHSDKRKICERKNCGEQIEKELGVDIPSDRSEYEKVMRIDEVASLLPFDSEYGDLSDETIGALCNECCASLIAVLEQRIRAEEELKKQYAERSSIENVTSERDGSSGRRCEAREKSVGKPETEGSEAVCPDQSRSPAPDMRHSKLQPGNSGNNSNSGVDDNDDVDRKLKEAHERYEKKRDELEAVRREKAEVMKTRASLISQRNDPLNNFLLDMSEQCEKDESLWFDAKAAEYEAGVAEGFQVFDVDKDKGTVNGYSVCSFDNPEEFSAALGLCSHMLYFVYKKTSGSTRPSYTLIPNGPESYLHSMLKQNSPDLSLCMTHKPTFLQQNSSYLLPLLPFGVREQKSEPQKPSAQDIFEEAMNKLNEEYFKVYCGKDLCLKPSKLTEDKWKENMRIFLASVYDKYSEISLKLH